MFDPLEAAPRCFAHNTQIGLLETCELKEPPSDYTYLALDEAHHCCNSAVQYAMIMQHITTETKILMCSDLSQASCSSAAVHWPTTGVCELKLTQVVRNSISLLCS